MIPPALPEEAVTAGLGERVRRAALGGLLAYAALAAAGLALGLTEYAMSRAFHLWSWVKIGLLYLVAACGVAVRITDSNAGPPGSAAVPPFETRLVPMLLLGLAGWLLVRAGRRIAAEPGARPRDLAACAAACTLAFSVPAYLSSLPVTLRFPEVGIGLLRPVAWQAVVFPLVVGLVATIAGLALGGKDGMVRAWVTGGWTAFAAALVLAFAGFLAAAALNPSATASYARGIARAGRYGPLLVVHHVLLLPNQSLDILAPSMGACVRVDESDRAGGQRSELTRLCLDGLRGSGVPEAFTTASPGRGVPLPAAYRLFVLVPLAAALAGGRRAARGARGSERIVRASGAGLVFATLVLAGSWLAAITVPFGVADMGAVLLRAGPAPLPAAAIAAVWGVLGGPAGSLLGRPAQARPGAPELPSPTSVK